MRLHMFVICNSMNLILIKSYIQIKGLAIHLPSFPFPTLHFPLSKLHRKILKKNKNLTLKEKITRIFIHVCIRPKLSPERRPRPSGPTTPPAGPQPNHVPSRWSNRSHQPTTSTSHRRGRGREAARPEESGSDVVHDASGEGAPELGVAGGGAAPRVRLLQAGLPLHPHRHGDLQPRRRRHSLPAPLHHRQGDSQESEHHQPQGSPSRPLRFLASPLGSIPRPR